MTISPGSRSPGSTSSSPGSTAAAAAGGNSNGLPLPVASLMVVGLNDPTLLADVPCHPSCSSQDCGLLVRFVFCGNPGSTRTSCLDDNDESSSGSTDSDSSFDSDSNDDENDDDTEEAAAAAVAAASAVVSV